MIAGAVGFVLSGASANSSRFRSRRTIGDGRGNVARREDRST